MDHNVILEKLNDIFRDVLENDQLELKGETTANDVENWDSLNHLILMMQIEKSFDIKFTAEEIQNFNNIRDLSTKIKEKLKV